MKKVNLVLYCGKIPNAISVNSEPASGTSVPLMRWNEKFETSATLGTIPNAVFLK